MKRTGQLPERGDSHEQPVLEVTGATANEGGSVASLLYETAPFLMGIGQVVGEDLVVISANRRAAQFFGEASETMVGRSGTELGTARDVEDLWLDRIREASRSGQPVRFEYRDPRGGDRPWLGVTVTALPSGDEEPLRYSFVAEDITERRRAEAALRRSEERLQAMIGIDGVGVLTLRQDGALIGANHAFLEMHGYSREEVESGELTWRDLTPEAYLAETERQMEKLAQTGRIGPYEKEYLRKDGSRSWLLFAGAALGDGTVVEYCIDVSDRKQAEAALRESEERLRLARDAAQLGIHDFDPVSGEIRWDDRVRELWGVGSDEEIDYDTFMAGVHPDDRVRCQAAVERALDPAGEGDYGIEYRVTNRADGETRWVAVTGQTTFEDGRAVRLVGTVQDITERKRFERELREALAAKEQFLGFISHELRTPMTVIQGMSRILAGRLPEGEEQEMAYDIASSAEELNDLIDSLLTLARLESEATAGMGTPCHLGRVVERVLERQRVRRSDREYRYRAEAARPVVEGEEAWLERVIVNLINNAAKYSPPDRAVTVVLENGPDEVCVRVLDEGDGLHDEELERLFEPFFRGQAHDGKVPGAGLGLAVSKRIVESMGGRMWAASRPQGGAEFGFAIPSVSTEAAPEV